MSYEEGDDSLDRFERYLALAKEVPLLDGCDVEGPLVFDGFMPLLDSRRAPSDNPYYIKVIYIDHEQRRYSRAIKAPTEGSGEI
jgi:hypothetical protein